MKKILVIVFLLAFVNCFSQPTNYTTINSRYNWGAGWFRGLHVPAFNTTPSLNSGQWTGAGAVGIDSILHRFYFSSGGSFRRILNASDSSLYSSVTRLADTAAAIRSEISPILPGASFTNPNDSIKMIDYINVLDRGFVADGVTNNRTAFTNLISSISSGGTTRFYFPSGTYYFDSTITVTDKPIEIFGQSGSPSSASPTIFKFPAGVLGIHITRSIGYQYYYLHDFIVQAPGTGTYNTAYSGIEINAITRMERVAVSGFRGEGIKLYGNVGLGTDVSLSYLESVNAQSNFGSGFYMYYGDANQITFVNCDARDNSRYGFYDSSFLGNQFIGCHGNANALGHYKVLDINARSSFIGCYGEGGSPASVFTGSCVIVGGIHANGTTLTDNSSWYAEGSTVHGRMNFNKLEASTRNSYIGFGDATMFYQSDGGHEYVWKSIGENQLTKFATKSSISATGNLNEFAGTDATITPPEAVSPDITRTMSTVGFSNNYNYIQGKRVQMLHTTLANLLSNTNAYPFGTGDQFQEGDVLYNANAYDSSDAMGWVCTSGGVVGTYSGGQTYTGYAGPLIYLSAPSTTLRIGDYINTGFGITRITGINTTKDTLTTSPSVGANAGSSVAYAAPKFKAFGIMKGTTANRPTLNLQDAGIWYYNTTLSNIQYWDGAAWISLPVISDVAYNASSWDGNTDAPSKNAVRDKIESLNLSSGTYTPTLTNTTNISASTAYSCQWMRVDSVITVSGKVDIDPTATGAVELRLTIPTTQAAFSNDFECGGTANSAAVATESAAISAVSSQILVAIKFIAVDLSNKSYFFTFTYRFTSTP